MVVKLDRSHFGCLVVRSGIRHTGSSSLEAQQALSERSRTICPALALEVGHIEVI